ncbi:MAG: succinate dehydrogenase cytochrome b subunit [Gemmatimonadota bacterium]|nr:succinate dehydrogenase cytochrome b subunit [Gemmatimonadota bacterium]MDH5758651.1 succinate dehydrogenase cytochrome b subunit [Gemmatimonadota bacterium]
MRRVSALAHTSVGKKVLMAVTGFIWFGFLVGHMAGNLKAFTGAEHFDEYAHHLRVFGEPMVPPMGFLWTFRLLVLVAFVGHVILAWQTSRGSHAARQVAYRKQEHLSFSRASGFMRWGGVAILVFVIFHLLHMTTGQLHPDFVEGAAYANLVGGLSSPVVAGLYVLAMVAVSAHLYHGLWSLFQTVGAAHPKYHAARRPLAVAAALVIFFGFISIPVAVLTGVLTF